jgi:hypothetical protein
MPTVWLSILFVVSLAAFTLGFRWPRRAFRRAARPSAKRLEELRELETYLEAFGYKTRLSPAGLSVGTKGAERRIVTVEAFDAGFRVTDLKLAWPDDMVNKATIDEVRSLFVQRLTIY